MINKYELRIEKVNWQIPVPGNAILYLMSTITRPLNTAAGLRIGDCQLRSYRLAQATTGEYSNYFGATSSAQSGLVMSQVVTAINRVNEVYEPELAVRLILIANTDQVFYYNVLPMGILMMVTIRN